MVNRSMGQRVTYWTCYAVILFLAVLFRFLPIRSGLPYSDYIDEGHVLHQTIDAFNHKSLDVYWYGLPPFPAYCAGAALFLYGPLYRHFHGHRFQKDLPNDRTIPSSKFYYDLITPPELIVAGRVVTACLSVASVILVGLIAHRVADYRAGLLAMLLVAVCPALVTRSSIVIVDTFATFFVLVVFCLCLQIRAETKKPIWLPVLFAGIGTGFVFSSKYPVASVGVAVVATILMLPSPWWQRFRLLLLAGGGGVLGILFGTPMTFIKPIAVWHDVSENIRAYNQIYSPQGYLAQAISTSELGIPLLLFGLAGMILMFWRTQTRAIAVTWILFGIVLVTVYAGSSFRPFRTFLSLVPLLCIAAAIAFSALVDWVRESPRLWWRGGLTIGLLLSCVGSLAFSSFQQVQRRMTHRDSRIQVIDWLQQHAGKDETILAFQELAILPAEWERVAASGTVVPWREALDYLKQRQFDYVVTGKFSLAHVSDPQVVSDYREKWKKAISGLAVHADFGQVETVVVPYVWHTNDERVLVYRSEKRQ